MICRLTGRLAAVGEDTAVLELGGVAYEVMVSAATTAVLQPLRGGEVTLFTVQYFEGNPAGAHLVPRLIGFLDETDRAFFNLFTRVKGISNRRALRAMALPTHQLAAAIDAGDVRLLTSLPEIGKKTAAQIVAELQGQVTAFLAPSAAPRPVAELTDAQRIALDILVSWGDRRADAQRWLAAAVDADPTLNEPDALVRAAYRVRDARGA